jgi:hypothetical protein
MSDRLRDLPFDDWIEHVFSHKAGGQEPQWWFDLDAPLWDGPAARTVAHLTRLFEDPEPPLEYFHDLQIAQGLYYMIDSGAGAMSLALFDPSVKLADRERGVRAILPLFAKLMAPRAAAHLSHLDRQTAGGGPLNGICYMWWDVFAIGGAEETARAKLDDAIFKVMVRTLALDSIACQESALHGLGHWPRKDFARVGPVIDAYLARSPKLRPELAAYASAARAGCVL